MSPELKRVIQKWLWPLMPGWVDEGRRMVQGTPLQALLDRAARTDRFPRVFNAGSGEGGYSPLLLKLPGVESVVESDFGFRDRRPSRIDERQVFFCASLTSIPLPDRKFELILCTEVLEHIQEDGLALDELTRVLAPGGWLLITVPTPPAPPDPAHVREGYRSEDLGAMLTQRGFDIIETRFCMRYFFRLLFKKWSWRPRIVVRALAYLDLWLPLGPPMDLMILAQLANEDAARVQPRAGCATVALPEASIQNHG